MVFLHLFLFLLSCAILYFLGEFLIINLIKIAKFFSLREFVVAFFLMAFASTLPNFFVGIISIVKKVPELSFADVVGGNIVDLTITVALATFFTKSLPAESKTIQTSAVFTMFIAILPLLLILDGILGREDGLVLISFFLFYFIWLFSKKERFKKIYDEESIGFEDFLKAFLKTIISILLLLFAAQGIVTSAIFFSKLLKISLTFIGILIVGLGNSLPEIYFAINSAKRGENWLILGNIMGSVIFPATLVLGLVALFSPFKITEFEAFFVSSIFLLISAILFFIFIKTGQKITKKEAFLLFGIYLIFVLFQVNLE